MTRGFWNPKHDTYHHTRQVAAGKRGAAMAKLPPSFRRDDLVAQGREAYRHGTSMTDCPYRVISHKYHGPAKTAWWEKGWIEAEHAATH